MEAQIWTQKIELLGWLEGRVLRYQIPGERDPPDTDCMAAVRIYWHYCTRYPLNRNQYSVVRCGVVWCSVEVGASQIKIKMQKKSFCFWRLVCRGSECAKGCEGRR